MVDVNYVIEYNSMYFLAVVGAKPDRVGGVHVVVSSCG